jgi:DNA invertase Pin-like site-specific DNA recombinase
MKASAAKSRLRCAIYTRKSSEEGLDQAFNSLHAQREACEAYVKSQAGEGWVVHPTVYDDGGISGGTMERPALKQLLADIDRCIVDIVVVYKVDRLTRSLMDFAKIVDRFDARSVSFVSVTQAFNTTNSMGRLTLNVLLSFAQFEREVTGERIRDKIAASKAKGMWMGGSLPVGYDAPTDPLTRALVVNPAQAELVRRLFDRYLALGSVHALKQELDSAGEVTRVHVARSGGTRGGQAYGRGALFHMLRNRVYVGDIVHGDKSYPGAHPPIIDPETFAMVQALLDANVSARRVRAVLPGGSPLAGKIVDADGLPMTPAMAYGRLGRKYRYYVSHPLQVGAGKDLDRDVIRRVAAGAIEALVLGHLCHLRLAAASCGWSAARTIINRVKLNRADVTISLIRGDLGAAAISAIRDSLPEGQQLVEIGGKAPRLELVIPGRAVFRGGRTWLASPDGASLAPRKAADPTLLQGLKRAHRVLETHNVSPLTKIEANRTARGIDDSYLRSIAGLAFLAPDIQAAIVEGRQPAGLTLEMLQDTKLPIAWADQRALLGFNT